MIGAGAADLARAARAAHARAARPAAAAVGGGRGGPADRRAAAPAAGRRPARAGGLGREARLRPAQPGDLRLGAGTARRGGAALRRLDDAPARERRLHRPRRPATATCAPRATRSRAAPRRSCATSSPSACSACPPEIRVDKDVAVEGPAPMTGDHDPDLGPRVRAGRAADLLYSDDRGRAARRGPRPARRPGGLAAVLARTETGGAVRHRAVADAGRRDRLRRPADAGGASAAPGASLREAAVVRGGAGPGRRAGPVPGQRRGGHGRAAARPATAELLAELAAGASDRRAGGAVRHRCPAQPAGRDRAGRRRRRRRRGRPSPAERHGTGVADALPADVLLVPPTACRRAVRGATPTPGVASRAGGRRST